MAVSGSFKLLGLVLLLTWFGRNHVGAQTDADPVKVTVFLETKCSDSVYFVMFQLGPTWEKLQDIMAVDFNAYGRITETPSGEGYEFSCEHGDDECKGNMVVECAKKHIPDVNIFVDFSICLLTSADPANDGPVCAETVGVPWDPIGMCSTSLEGQQLLHEAGLAQNALDPKPDFMPWIIINDVFTRENLDEAQSDLTGLVCRTYEGTPPPACQ